MYLVPTLTTNKTYHSLLHNPTENEYKGYRYKSIKGAVCG